MFIVLKTFAFKAISAIILSEMSVHRRVISQIAYDAALLRQSSITRRSLALKIARSNEYKQLSMLVVLKMFDFKVISAMAFSRISTAQANK